MITCSNCGATAREGAKFCTSCGTRLNQATVSDSQQPWGQPASNDDAPASASGNNGDARPDNTLVSEPGVTNTEPDETATTTGEQSEPASSWSWSRGAEDTTQDEPAAEPAPDHGPAPGNGGEGEDTASRRDDTTATTASSASAWSWDETVQPESESEEASATDEGDRATAEQTSAGEYVEDTPLAADPGTDDERPDDSTDRDTDRGAEWTTSYTYTSTTDRDASAQDSGTSPFSWASSSSESSSWQDDGDAESAAEITSDIGTGTNLPVDTVAATEATVDESASEHTADEDPRAQAERLLDQLRELLPALSATGATSAAAVSPEPAGEPDAVASGIDAEAVQGVVDQLTSVRDRPEDFDDLRATLESARTRPRDVDTMLDLVGRVDNLIALLDSRDRYGDAIDHAIEQLRSISNQ